MSVLLAVTYKGYALIIRIQVGRKHNAKELEIIRQFRVNGIVCSKSFVLNVLLYSKVEAVKIYRH
jgi:hypothetical protein